MISILCAHNDSNYFKIPGLDIWTADRDCYNFSGKNKVIAHPPCQQWSRLRKFSNYNLKEKLLAEWCWDIVNQNGGIFEHPANSYFFKYINADKRKILSVDQCWFGFPGRKSTWLYFHNCQHAAFPIMHLPRVKDITSLSQHSRSKQCLSFCQWLISSHGLEANV